MNKLVKQRISHSDQCAIWFGCQPLTPVSRALRENSGAIQNVFAKIMKRWHLSRHIINTKLIFFFKKHLQFENNSQWEINYAWRWKKTIFWNQIFSEIFELFFGSQNKLSLPKAYMRKRKKHMEKYGIECVITATNRQQ